jgi:hypothetical protein
LEIKKEELVREIVEEESSGNGDRNEKEEEQGNGLGK